MKDAEASFVFLRVANVKMVKKGTGVSKKALRGMGESCGRS